MRYKSFRVQNFKGIKDTTINLDAFVGTGVFALVGLNESGKTTVLEAIHSFSPDEATSELLGGEEGTGVPFNQRVPRHLISEFTGDVSVTATLSVTEDDKRQIANSLWASAELALDVESFPDQVVFERKQRFEGGDFEASFFLLKTPLLVKTKQQRKWRAPEGGERAAVRKAVSERIPDIAYFPTNVFNFPERIYLTDRGTEVDAFYRRVFQDILDFDGRKQTIEDDIIRRVRREETNVPWASFWSIWGKHDDRDKIQQVMDRASAAVSKLIFGRWNKIFGEDTKGKEVSISYEIEEGEVENDDGSKRKTNAHDVVIKFQIKDGTRRFNVNDRSLGFRWFFSFMLFTQFRVARSSSGSRPLLFLFDEPASNLHAAAQQKLIESFPEVAKGEHVLAYSTHSHYMIEPKWLEQTFIVTNRADAPPASVLDEISLDDESLDVQVTPYRSFVNAHPSQTSYFQPILDRLSVVPSKFDPQRPSIVLEGKSDYYILRYAQRLLNLPELPLLPGLGAGTFGALAALQVGWNLNFIFMLDGDPAGMKERERYETDFGISSERLVTLDDLIPDARVIEDVIDEEAKGIIRSALGLGGGPSKAQILRYFQERLASDTLVPLGDRFAKNTSQILSGLKQKLACEEA